MFYPTAYFQLNPFLQDKHSLVHAIKQIDVLFVWRVELFSFLGQVKDYHCEYQCNEQKTDYHNQVDHEVHNSEGSWIGYKKGEEKMPCIRESYEYDLTSFITIAPYEDDYEDIQIFKVCILVAGKVWDQSDNDSREALKIDEGIS